MARKLRQPKTTFAEIEGVIGGLGLVHVATPELLTLRRWHLMTYDGNHESRMVVDAIDFLLQRPKRARLSAANGN